MRITPIFLSTLLLVACGGQQSLDQGHIGTNNWEQISKKASCSDPDFELSQHRDNRDAHTDVVTNFSRSDQAFMQVLTDKDGVTSRILDTGDQTSYETGETSREEISEIMDIILSKNGSLTAYESLENCISYGAPHLPANIHSWAEVISFSCKDSGFAITILQEQTMSDGINLVKRVNFDSEPLIYIYSNTRSRHSIESTKIGDRWHETTKLTDSEVDETYQQRFSSEVEDQLFACEMAFSAEISARANEGFAAKELATRPTAVVAPLKRLRSAH